MSFWLSRNKYVRDLVTLPADLRRAWNKRRLRGVRREIRERTLDRVYQRGRSWVYERDLEDTAGITPPSGLRLDEFTGDDWSSFADVSTERDRDRFRRARERGRICVAAWRGKRVVGYTWLSPRVEPDLEAYPIPLPDDAAYGWNTFVASNERGRGLGALLIRARDGLARARGFRRVWRAIDVDNVASLRSLEQSSSSTTRRIGELTYTKVFSSYRAHYRFLADE